MTKIQRKLAEYLLKEVGPGKTLNIHYTNVSLIQIGLSEKQIWHALSHFRGGLIRKTNRTIAEKLGLLHLKNYLFTVSDDPITIARTRLELRA